MENRRECAFHQSWSGEDQLECSDSFRSGAGVGVDMLRVAGDSLA